jgi:hypothetical protein
MPIINGRYSAEIPAKATEALALISDVSARSGPADKLALAKAYAIITRMAFNADRCRAERDALSQMLWETDRAERQKILCIYDT